ncbi:MAG TPA: SLC13 family permease [Spirochaetota bacterium]|nr:SLC13 family permease [Spirochaetota bacterium]HPI89582.1 SLC13 family permease [Spirochaetota bacterium]HPR49917.1 SLC13 family permease [Spirochaetota bacterium]
MTHTTIAALIIFVITYTGIIFTRIPGINIDRPSSAFFGAVAMVVFGVISFEDAVRAVDFNTIALLLGMMIIIITLEMDGFFSLIARSAVSFGNNPRRLLWIIVFTTGISSAFLVNDAVVLLFTPVIIAICRSSKLEPLPFLIAEILSSNAGSAMTMTGNPQNMLIGIRSGISYGTFLLHLLPVSIISMIVVAVIVRLAYAKHFKQEKHIDIGENDFRYNFASMKSSVPIFILVMVLFFFSRKLGLSLPVIALAGAALVLIFGKIRPSKIIREVDWVLLIFFASLFIVVSAFEKTGFMKISLLASFLDPAKQGIAAVHGFSLVLSQVISNVPLVVAVLPVFEQKGSTLLWLSLASGSTLAGNATIIGAMANLIVIESARGEGIVISFREFLKTGIPVTIATMLLSIAILWIEFRFFNLF